MRFYLPEKAKKSILIMEAGTEGKNAIKVTDKILLEHR